ncbi:hypothetical protein B0H14DRAFT_2621768 [Mycena olivaceomarginata]|nr:hypothetical protein B0H14DRAFT_2621768 [Mycena olivaceomarginata]
MNSLMLWDANVPRQIVQALNHYAFCSSYFYQAKAMQSISRDGVRLARQVANDPTKLILLPNDNFNWAGKAWETSATHGTVMHDQVSAILVVLNLPPGSLSTTASQLANIDNFAQTVGTCHRLPPHQSLEDIVPTSHDQQIFEDNALKHIAYILSEEVKGFLEHHKHVQCITDPHALPFSQSEEYYLPTFDQEQSSTQGNMKVMEHYFQNVL